MVSFGSHVDFSVPHIKIRNLNKYYNVQGNQVQALKNINLDIPKGKIFGIIGKSGAGKSSLIRTLNGLETISDGHIHIDQQDLIPAPSPRTKPARRWSKGNDACLGSSARVNALQLAKPAILIGLTAASEPPVMMASA